MPVASVGFLVLMVWVMGGPQRPAATETLEAEGAQADPGMGNPCAQHRGTLGLVMKGRREGLETHSPQRPLAGG